MFLPKRIENLAEFFAMLEEAFALFKPERRYGSNTVARLVQAQYSLLCCQRAYDDYDLAMCRQKPDYADWTAQERQKLQLLYHYKKQAEAQHRITAYTVPQINKYDIGDQASWQAWYALHRYCFYCRFYGTAAAV